MPERVGGAPRLAQPLGDPHECHQIFARRVEQLDGRRRKGLLEASKRLAPGIGHFEDLDPPVGRGRPSDDLAARFQPIDDVGDPGRVDSEAGCQLVRGTGWRLSDSPEELGHDPAQTHGFDLVTHGLKATLPVLHEKAPRTPRELFPIILLIHGHRLTLHYH